MKSVLAAFFYMLEKICILHYINRMQICPLHLVSEKCLKCSKLTVDVSRDQGADKHGVARNLSRLAS